MLADRAEDLTVVAGTSFDAGDHGDIRSFDQLFARPRTGESPENQAWDIARRAARASFDTARERPPTVAEAGQLALDTPSVAAIVARACASMERLAVRTFDRPALSAWIALHGSLATSDSGPAAISLRVARLWELLLAGKTDGLETQAKTTFEEASRRNAGAEAAEATVIRALVALSAGTLDDAAELARRASRMAHSGALPQEEYLANIVLARVGRYRGQTHLALHILAALARLAPRSWWGWIGWETLLAGGRRPRAEGPGGPNLSPTPSVVAEASLSDVIEAARAGARGTFDAAANRLSAAASVWPQLAQEATALLAALDPAGRSAPEAMAAWQRGETALVPFGLQCAGVSGEPDGQTESATAYVFAQPGQPARRLLVPGLPLLGETSVLARLSTPRSGARTETAIAALALSGESAVPRETFFRNVYGFPFVGHRHRAVLDVLCHRMRSLLGSSGEIRRQGYEAPGPRSGANAASAGPTITLTLREAVAVADRRCVLPFVDRVLRTLAMRGASSANDVVETLGIPLRSVQAVLQRLVSEGACAVERDGRHISYRIEYSISILETSA